MGRVALTTRGQRISAVAKCVHAPVCSICVRVRCVFAWMGGGERGRVGLPRDQVRGALLTPIQQFTSGFTAGFVGQLASTISPLETQAIACCLVSCADSPRQSASRAC